MRGVVTSRLVCSSLDRVVQVCALARDIVLCSWARHLTLTVPLSTQVYKWVPANLMLGVTLRWISIHPGDKLHPDGPLRSYTTGYLLFNLNIWTYSVVDNQLYATCRWI